MAPESLDQKLGGGHVGRHRNAVGVAESEQGGTQPVGEWDGGRVLKIQKHVDLVKGQQAADLETSLPVFRKES